MTTTRISEIKNVKVVCCSNGPSVCLRWLNKLGGWSTWVFDYNQVNQDETSRDSISVNTSSASLFSQYTPDLEAGDSTQDSLTIKVQPKMLLGYTNLAKEDIIGIRGMLHSVKVHMLMNADTWVNEGPRWQTVLIDPSSFTISETRMNHYELEFTILLPELYTAAQ